MVVYEEDEMNSFRLQKSLRVTASKVGQLLCREVSAGMDELTWLC
jgi:hypothetical protein